MDYRKESLRLHGEWKGKIEVIHKVPVSTRKSCRLLIHRVLQNHVLHSERC